MGPEVKPRQEQRDIVDDDGSGHDTRETAILALIAPRKIENVQVCAVINKRGRDPHLIVGMVSVVVETVVLSPFSISLSAEYITKYDKTIGINHAKCFDFWQAQFLFGQETCHGLIVDSSSGGLSFEFIGHGTQGKIDLVDIVGDVLRCSAGSILRKRFGTTFVLQAASI